jgi:ankyrin repeat protein
MEMIPENCSIKVIIKEPFAVPKRENSLRKSDGSINYEQFFEAIYNGNASYVKNSLKDGANPDRTNWTGQSALHEAASTGNLDIVKLLLRYQAAPNKLGVDKQTPLHIAAQKGWFLICSALLNAGADYNIQDKNGNTPLHEAASKNRAGVCTLILAQGNAKLMKNKQNKLPVDLAPKLCETFKVLSGEFKLADVYEYSGLAFAQADKDELVFCDSEGDEEYKESVISGSSTDEDISISEDGEDEEDDEETEMDVITS